MLTAQMRDGTKYAQYIDIFGDLELSDYYRTDAHWRQEQITDVARHLAGAMGVNPATEYETKELENPTEEEIKEYLAGNLCRCSGFVGQTRSILKYLEYKKNGNIQEKEVLA